MRRLSRLEAVAWGAVLACVAAPLDAAEGAGAEAAVRIQQVRVSLERHGEWMRVSEMVQLTVDQGEGVPAMSGLSLPLPAGALGPRPVGEEDQAIRLTDEAILVDGAVDSRGRIVSVMYDLPIRGGRVVHEQRFGRPVDQVQVISTWTAGQTRLVGDRLGEARPVSVRGGLIGLVAMGQGLGDGHLRFELTGIEDGPGRAMALAALLSSLLLFGLGLWVYVRRRAAGLDDDAKEQ